MKKPRWLRLRKDWRFITAKYIINRKWENGFVVTFDTIFDHSEDWAKPTILAKGDLFIDGGAHCGFWSLQASKYYDRIIAFEPTKKTARSLRSNLRTNRIQNVQIIEAALSDKDGQAPFYTWEPGPMGNSLYNEPVTYTSDYGFGGNAVRVKTVAIDDLNVTPTLIKLDVEGAEFDAVLGSLKTVRRCHPKFFIEIHRPGNKQKIVDTLPGYHWTERTRLMQPIGKQEFNQIQMIGEWSSS